MNETLLRIYWDLFCCIICGLSWRMFHVHLKKNVYCAVFEWNVLKMSIMSIWYNVTFKAIISFWIFFQNYLSIDVSGLLESTIFVVDFMQYRLQYSTGDHCISLPLCPLIIALCTRCSCDGCTDLYDCCILLLNWPFYSYVISFVFFVFFFTLSILKST